MSDDRHAKFEKLLLGSIPMVKVDGRGRLDNNFICYFADLR
jgi:hypothetical protein